MIDQDFGFRIKELSSRVTEVENQIRKIMKKAPEFEDWDNATLMKEWGISRRTAANYRSQGLKFYKRGGRIYYSPEHRNQFTKNIRYDNK